MTFLPSVRQHASAVSPICHIIFSALNPENIVEVVLLIICILWQIQTLLIISFSDNLIVMAVFPGYLIFNTNPSPNAII
ncbi:hypothetical protein EDB82DRAFT_511263 [Fusarium venenatum]|uniref:uncharacterized protein n=1 Tax=Fusarium venenatum TaxID=56646 RepID=UPI001DA2FAF6|nr:hypothetical protein EDB82DRAFT_511263 [Fusarium venenatum]